MTRLNLTPRGQRLALIVDGIARASEPTLHQIETLLGLTPRPQSPDAGKPWSAEG
jgi:hypothetical protein